MDEMLHGVAVLFDINVNLLHLWPNLWLARNFCCQRRQKLCLLNSFKYCL